MVNIGLKLRGEHVSEVTLSVVFHALPTRFIHVLFHVLNFEYANLKTYYEIL